MDRELSSVSQRNSSAKRPHETKEWAESGDVLRLDFARDVELHPIHHHLSGAGEADDIDRAGIFGRARVIGGNRAVADLRSAIPVAERDVIRAGGRDLGIADEPGRAREDAAVDARIVVSCASAICQRVRRGRIVSNGAMSP